MGSKFETLGEGYLESARIVTLAVSCRNKPHITISPTTTGLFFAPIENREHILGAYRHDTVATLCN